MCYPVQMMAQNLRGEMSGNLAGANICLSDSRFIQVIAKSLSISCKEVRLYTDLSSVTTTVYYYHFTQKIAIRIIINKTLFSFLHNLTKKPSTHIEIEAMIMNF